MPEFFWGEFLPLLTNKNPVQVLHRMFVTKLKLKLVFHQPRRKRSFQFILKRKLGVELTP
jgi:hypothetical protein